MRRITDLLSILAQINIPQTIINEGGLFGIFAILALSLNLEYGYTGIPNFGKVFFLGLGAFITGTTVTHLITWFVSQSTEICSAAAIGNRVLFAFSSPGVLGGIFVLTLVISAVITGGFGYLLSYPALRLREDYLGILLIATGEILRVFVRGLPSNVVACEADSLNAIPNPFLWLSKLAPPFGPKLPPPFGWVDAVMLVSGSFAAVILGIMIVCFVLVSRLSNSPYGRMLKSIRDDEPAALSLGKNPARIRGQVMIIGSAMAGVAGALFSYYLGSIDTGTFIPLKTFQIWAIVLLGGAANNRGVILGSFVFVSIDLLTLIGRSAAAQLSPQFQDLLNKVPVDAYLQTIIVGAIIILIIFFRPQGLLREKPIKTPAWDVMKDASNSLDKESD